MNALCREVSRWSHASDSRLRRIFGYVKGTLSFGLVWRVKETHQLMDTFVISHSDTDHGGDVSARSTSGWTVHYGIESMEAWLIVDWNSRRQGATARSTAEAEVGGANDCMIRSTIPMMELLSVYQDRDMDDGEDEPLTIHFIDAEAARMVISGRRQTLMGHLRKHQRIDLGVLRDLFVPPSRFLKRKDTKLNIADALTKPMKDHETFLRHRVTMGVADVMEFRAFFVRADELPERPPRSLLSRAASSSATLVREATGHLAGDPEVRSRVLQWGLRKVLGGP